jgi:biopolymer transport protein ExbD
MGYDERHQASSGPAVAVVVAVLIVSVLGLVVIGGVALIWLRASTLQQHAEAVEQRAVAEAHLAEAEARRALAEARAETTPDPRLTFRVAIDREGNTSVDGDYIDLAELGTRLVKLKEETSNAFSVYIDADPDCPVKRVVPVVDLCNDVGDIDYLITSIKDPSLRITATVASYEAAAEWDHFDDGKFSAYDVITLKVVTPEQHAGTTFSVTVPPTEFPEYSAFRTTGTRLTFTIRESDIGATGLAWGAINDPTIEQ